MEQEKSFVRGSFESLEYFAERIMLTVGISNPEEREHIHDRLTRYLLEAEARNCMEGITHRITGILLTVENEGSVHKTTVIPLGGENPCDPKAERIILKPPAEEWDHGTIDLYPRDEHRIYFSRYRGPKRKIARV